LGERFRLQGQSAASALWKSRLKCYKPANFAGETKSNTSNTRREQAKTMIDREAAWCLLTVFGTMLQTAKLQTFQFVHVEKRLPEVFQHSGLAIFVRSSPNSFVSYSSWCDSESGVQLALIEDRQTATVSRSGPKCLFCCI